MKYSAHTFLIFTLLALANSQSRFTFPDNPDTLTCMLIFNF